MNGSVNNPQELYENKSTIFMKIQVVVAAPKILCITDHTNKLYSVRVCRTILQLLKTMSTNGNLYFAFFAQMQPQHTYRLFFHPIFQPRDTLICTLPISFSQESFVINVLLGLGHGDTDNTASHCGVSPHRPCYRLSRHLHARCRVQALIGPTNYEHHYLSVPVTQTPINPITFANGSASQSSINCS